MHCETKWTRTIDPLRVSELLLYGLPIDFHQPIYSMFYPIQFLDHRDPWAIVSVVLVGFEPTFLDFQSRRYRNTPPLSYSTNSWIGKELNLLRRVLRPSLYQWATLSKSVFSNGTVTIRELLSSYLLSFPADTKGIEPSLSRFGKLAWQASTPAIMRRVEMRSIRELNPSPWIDNPIVTPRHIHRPILPYRRKSNPPRPTVTRWRLQPVNCGTLFKELCGISRIRTENIW